MTIRMFINLDLLSVGLAIAGIGVLGFVVFFNNRKSITNKTFLLFSLITIFWGIANYLNYQTNSSLLVFGSIIDQFTRFILFRDVPADIRSRNYDIVHAFIDTVFVAAFVVVPFMRNWIKGRVGETGDQRVIRGI